MHKPIIIVGEHDFSWMMGRPQQLAIALADTGHKVFYVSNRGAPIKYSDNLLVDVSPEDERLPRTDVVVYISNPLQVEFVRWLKEYHLWYDIFEHESICLGKESTPRYFRAKEAALSNAKIITTSSVGWHSHKGTLLSPRKNPKILLMHNGCSPNAQDKAVSDEKSTGSMGGLLSELGDNYVVYLGTMGFWVDMPLMRHCFIKNPDVQFVVVGSSKSIHGEYLNYPNVRTVCEVIWNKAQVILSRARCSIIPYTAHPVGICKDPIKMYESLYYGVPVVMTPGFYEHPLVLSEETSDDIFHDFSTAIGEVVAYTDLYNKHTPNLPDMNEHSWNKRIERLEHRLNQL